MVKIGTTTDLDGRLKAIQATSPLPLKLLATQPGGHAIERALHKRFWFAREHGEWFKLDKRRTRRLVGLMVSRRYS